MKPFWKPGEPKPAQTQESFKNKNAQLAILEEPNLNKIEKPQLSKSVMGMKFMKRKEEAIRDGKEEAAKRKKMLSNSWSTISDEPSASLEVDEYDTKLTGFLSIIKDSDNLFASLPGRRSFKGFNPYIERQYAMLIDTNKELSKEEKPGLSTISDEEMAERYSKLISLPRGPNQGRLAEGWKK